MGDAQFNELREIITILIKVQILAMETICRKLDDADNHAPTAL